jgi:hypothetical protein
MITVKQISYNESERPQSWIVTDINDKTYIIRYTAQKRLFVVTNSSGDVIKQIDNVVPEILSIDYVRIFSKDIFDWDSFSKRTATECYYDQHEYPLTKGIIDRWHTTQYKLVKMLFCCDAFRSFYNEECEFSNSNGSIELHRGSYSIEFGPTCGHPILSHRSSLTHWKLVSFGSSEKKLHGKQYTVVPEGADVVSTITQGMKWVKVEDNES